MERVLVGPPCRTTMPGIERPANAREGDTARWTLARTGFAAVRVATGRITPHGKDRNTAQGGNRVTQVR